MEFRILGPLEVVHDGAPIRVGAAKEQAVLAVLLLHAGEVVSRERLIDELWGESPPATAARAVNNHISQLRKALAVNGSDPVVTRAGGYAIDVAPSALDAAAFEQLVAAGRRRIAAGDVEGAAKIFRKALALWRGPALAGIGFESLARSEVDRLEELRLGALLDRIDCDLALARHDAIIAELEALVAQYPLRERLRAQHMLALYRCGRQADALRSYQDARKVLVEELGLEPSPALQRLEQAILNHDRALQAPAGVARRPPDVERRPRSRRWLLIGSIAAAGIVAGVLATGHARGVAVAANSVAVIDRTTGRVITDIPVGIDPGPIAVTTDSVWVANTEDRTLSRIDVATRRVTRTVPLRATPTGIAAGHGAVWVAHGLLGTVARISPRYDEIAATIHVTEKPRRYASADGVVAADGMVWAGFGDSTVARISRADNNVVARAYADAPVAAIAVRPDAVWVAERDGTLARVDPRTASFVTTPVGVAPRPAGIAVSDTAEWVSSPSTGRIAWVVGNSSRTITTGRGPMGLAYRDGFLWVANSGDGTVSRLNARTGAVEKTIKVGNRPAGIALTDRYVWVTVEPR